MRKFIRWIADVSGVSTEIRHETMKEIGGRIYQDHYWFNGHKSGAWMVCNTLAMYGKSLRDLCYPNVSEIRSDVYKIGDRHDEKQ